MTYRIENNPISVTDVIVERIRRNGRGYGMKYLSAACIQTVQIVTCMDVNLVLDYKRYARTADPGVLGCIEVRT